MSEPAGHRPAAGPDPRFASPVAPATLHARADRVQRRIADLDVRAFLTLAPANARYLTGYAGALTGGVLVIDRRVLAFVDNRYKVEARQLLGAVLAPAGHLELISIDRRAEVLQRELGAGDVLGVEDEIMSVAEFRALEELLPDRTVTGCADPIRQERLVKEPLELARIRAAAAVTDAAITDLLAMAPIGWSEVEITAFLETRMRAIGSAGPAFETLVAVGPRTALPHAQPTGARLERDSPLLIDVGAKVDGYASDLARTVWWGRVPAELERLRAAVEAANVAVFELVRPGVEVGALDDAARSVFDRHGVLEHVEHPSGHNVGLEIHERPFLTPRHSGTLSAGNVITVEPGLYLPGVGGFRVEDTVLVTASGPVRLTLAARDAQQGSTGERSPDPQPHDDLGGPEHPDPHGSFLLGGGPPQ
jgi:Xaa-Pro aminopeptidase